MAAANSSYFNAVLLSLLVWVAFQSLSNVSGSIANGFYVNLIHRDSRESPFYDPSSTSFSRFQAAVNRSASRLHYLRHGRFLDSLNIPLANSNFEYLIIFDIGSESQKVFASIDTGSDLIWVLCNPCPNCYQHVHTIFDPLSSQSYKKLDCRIPTCTEHGNTSCDTQNMCYYHAEYIDKAYVEGILSTDTFKFNIDDGTEKFAMDNAIFGCTHKTNGDFHKKSIGIVGLNRDKLSLTSQLSPFIGKRFSYCLSSKINHHTRLYFGAAAIVSGPGAMITPMYYGKLVDQYYLLLKGIKVGKEKPIVVSRDKHEGNIILDSGTPMTYIQPNILQQFIEKVKKHIPFPLKHHDHYGFCFNTSSLTGRPLVPKITFMFDNDVQIVLSKHGVFRNVDKNTLCCLIASTQEHDGLQIFGNRAQEGYRIGFDVQEQTITIRKENC